MAESKFTPLVCIYCSAIFTPTDKRQTLCSKNCKVKRWKRDNPRPYKPEYRQPYVRKMSVCIFGRCALCDTAFYAKRSGVTTCSAACWHTLSGMRTHREVARVVRCNQCNSEFCPLFGSSHATFCEPCAAIRKDGDRRAHKARRNARMRGAQAEYFDPISIFEMCGWRCYLCGIDTPKLLRGTQDDRAPELDHVHPLSRGGAHAIDNVMLACRLCNNKKADKLLTEFELPAYTHMPQKC